MSGTFSREMVFPENELSDVAAFLAKPFSEETLMEAIRNALS
jgi:FixJ family two-component response regulator